MVVIGIVSFIPVMDTDRVIFESLDISDMPRYSWVQNTVALSLQDASVKIVGLIIAAVLLFYLAYLSFIKYDVR